MHRSQRFSISIIFVCLSLAGADEIFIVREKMANGTTELQCFFNGPQEKSSGLAWVLPPGVSYIRETHQRWKHKASEAFVRGHFEYYGHIWESMNSLNVKQNLLPPVLDERWNGFNQVITEPDENFIVLSKFSTNRFHLSILAKSDAQIALHVGDSAHTSMTYLLTLDPIDNLGSVTLEMCPGGIGKENGTSKCSLLAKTESPASASLLKNGKEWTHFTITVEEAHNMAHHLTIADATKKGKILLDYRKHQAYHRLPTAVSVKTLGSSGTWRIHEHRVVIHNGKGDGEGFNVIEVSKPTNSCLQIHYFFRSGFGKAFVRTKDGSFSVELEPTDGQWKYAVIRAPLQAPSDYLHFVAPFGDHLRYVGSIFAMHQPFRVCGEDEFFTSKVLIAEGRDPTNAVCQSITNEPVEQYATLQKTIFTGPLENSCPSNSFGKFCNITCGSVMSDQTCKNKVQCDKYRCNCLPGYQPTSDWETSCATPLVTPAVQTNVTFTPFEAVEDEDSSENKEDSEGYVDWDYMQGKDQENDKSYWLWWFVAISCSWVITMGSLFLVFKERPDLVPVWIYSPIMRCTGQNRGGDQLINEDAS